MDLQLGDHPFLPRYKREGLSSCSSKPLYLTLLLGLLVTAIGTGRKMHYFSAALAHPMFQSVAESPANKVLLAIAIDCGLLFVSQQT